MARFEEPHEETNTLYERAILQTNLENFINITIVINNSAKEIFKVNKASELLKYRSGDDVIIVINENILDQLTPEQRVIVVEESLASITFNTEKDKLEIRKPDVVTFSGILSRYSFNTWNTLRESIKALYSEEEVEEDQTENTTT